MAVYVLGIGKVTDDAWTTAYGANVHEIVHRHGGRYLSRSANITPLEGETPDATMVALVQFPTLESAQEFFDDPDYDPYREARQAGSVAFFLAVDDTDALGTVPYLSHPAR